MMCFRMGLGKCNIACCFYETRARKPRFETIVTMAWSSAAVHVALNNGHLARQKLARLEQIQSKLASKR